MPEPEWGDPETEELGVVAQAPRRAEKPEERRCRRELRRRAALR